MLVLGIESSCDETSAAVLNGDYHILSNIVLSQDKIHAPYGGVVPELASRQHIRSIGYVVNESLDRAELRLPDVDYFAVTQGPGLIGSLLVGLSFAKGLAFFLKKPLIPVDHLEAHIHSAFIENPNIQFPALALLVSGGHTSIYRLEKKLGYELKVKTRDDAAGEALDKIAKYLDLGYPGGPVIDRMAENGDPSRFVFALPQMRDGSLDFSFSGLKTAALKHIREASLTKGHPHISDFLASFQGAIVRALLTNLKKIVERGPVRSLILAGGVARNRALRDQFVELAQDKGLECFIPSPELCTDNAAMVAGLAIEKISQNDVPSNFLDLNAYARKN
ncbi:tRNA (adenosine(37)-N6)-threonylcarbamoyltransferase complex transferase subunit TsaD [Acidobacteriota bacterium]